MKFAKWICAPTDTGSAAVVFKRSFAAEKVSRAIIKVSGLGTYEARINGIKIGMLCYTYSSGLSDKGIPRLNGNSPMENEQLINWFYNRNPQKKSPQ